MEIASFHLKTTDVFRLSIALNFSVFLQEIKKDLSTACKVAKKASDEAVADLEQLEESMQIESSCVIKLIKENLLNWTAEIEQQNESN